MRVKVGVRRGAVTAALAAAALLAVAVAPGDGARSAGPGAAPAEGAGRSPATTATAAAAPPVTAAPAAPRSFTLVATGDVLLHPRLWEQAHADAVAAGGDGFDFGPLLAGVAPVVRAADVAVCHLETPLAPAGGPYSGYPSFSVPPEIAPALAAAGYDACSTASNHTFDGGAAGIDRTLADLDAAGIRHAGSARTPDEAAAITLVPVRPGADVALLSYTFGFNGVPAPGGDAWRANTIDQARILADAARARAAGAEVVVVALHWGEEYRSEPTAQQSALGPALVRSPDIDLVLGHHAHVVQPIEPVDGEWVVYGLGNMVAFHGTSLPANQEGLLVRFTFTEGPAGWSVSDARWEALYVTRTASVRLVDVGAALAGAGPAGVDPARLAEAEARTAAAVGGRGGPAAGLRPLLAP
jgi:poly-gamma-glutamate synthesis protein (capsule biosynthesis protein)